MSRIMIRQYIMEIVNTQTDNKNDATYTNDLNKIEAQIVQQEQKETFALVTKSPIISDECCFKLFISFLSLIALGPFAICDVYYGVTDTSCLTQSQTQHNLNITLHAYLLASGSIMLIFIGAFNFYLFALDINIVTDKYSEEATLCAHCVSYIFRGFGVSWLVLGCVLFWAYTNISDCSQSVHDYMFARLIIGIISTAFSGCKGNDK